MDAPLPPLLDDSLWPLVRVTLPRGLTLERSEELLDAVRACLRREERHVYLMDMRAVHALSSEQRARMGAFLREEAEGMRRWCMGIVGLINSPTLAVMARLLIHHVKPSTVPYSVLASWPAAVDWVAERLEVNGRQAQARLAREHLLAPPCSRT